jgi:AcrR family transcriptional regulator
MGIIERKEREKEHRKEEILDAAQKVFFEKGLSTATMDEIAEVAELSKGTLYLYYKSKEDMYLAVMMRGMDILYEKTEPIVASNDSTTQKLVKLVDIYKDYFRLHRNFFRMLHFLQAPQFHKQVSDEMRQACNIESRKMWDLVIGLFQRAIDDKLIRPGLNPIELAIILWSSSTALMLKMDAEREFWKQRMQIDLAETLELSNSLFLSAMFTDKGQRELEKITHR